MTRIGIEGFIEGTWITNMTSKKEQIEILFIRLQRTFVLWALRFYGKIDSFLGSESRLLGPSQVFGATTEAEIDVCLTWLNKQHNRPLVRVAFWAHSRLDELKGIKGRILICALWFRTVAWKIFSQKRYGGYSRWIQMYDNKPLTLAPRPNSAPRIAVVLWVAKMRGLKSLLKSVKNQVYPCDELIVVGPSKMVSVVERYFSGSAFSGKVSYVLHESTLKNIEQIKHSECDYFVFITGSGILAQNALFEIVNYVRIHPNSPIMYGDEDELNWRRKRVNPRFHPDWDVDYGLAQNVFANLAIVKGQELGRIGNRHTRVCNFYLSLIKNDEHVGHIPRVLFHSFNSAKTTPDPDWFDATKDYMREHHPRSQVVHGFKGKHRIIWSLPDLKPTVSLLIPTKDRVDLLENLVDGLLNRTAYPIHEIIIIDNQSELGETKAYLEKIQEAPIVHVLEYNHPFNYSAINNFAFGFATGEVIGLLNNDLEVISPGWLEEMVRQALRPEVGIVGAKLYYKNNFIQHAGVVLGVGPVAGHMHPLEHRSTNGYCDRLLFAHSYSAVTGACMLMRRSVFESLDGLNDKDLAVAYNDIDICLRARELGYKIIWTPYAELYHLESASRPIDTLPMQVQRYRKEIEYMRGRWKKYFEYDETYNPNLSLEGHHFEVAFPPRRGKPCSSY